MEEYGMNEFELIKKADVMRIINAENAVVLNNLKERSTDEVLCAIASHINGLQTTAKSGSRLIDADAFSEQYGNYYAEQGTAEGYIGTVGDLIAKQPTIEAVPVRQGRWVHIDAGFRDSFLCSNCGTRIVLTDRWRFCPNCGAKMDAEDTDVLITDRYGNEMKMPKQKPTLQQSLDAWALLNELLELGYPHNFQHEAPHISGYLFDLSALIDKALKIKKESEIDAET